MKSICSAFLLACLALPASAQTDKEIISLFRDPPRSARPYLWWHWMDGEVSIEGISKDLEWMDAVGIAGFHQFDAGGVNMPKAAPFKRPYLSESWKEAFAYAVRKADSLNFEMTIASAPGWSSTGGPWVTPEDAMKKLEWQSVTGSGGKIILPELAKVTGPYRDIPAKSQHRTVEPYGYDVALVAVKLSAGDRSMEEMGAVISREGEQCIRVTFPRKETIRALTIRTGATGIRPRKGEERCPNVLECSHDGRNWKSVKKIHQSPLEYQTLNIPATRARYFRVKGEQLQGLELYTVNKVEQSEEKAAFALIYDFAKHPTTLSEEGKGLFARETLVLRPEMEADGKMSCTLPEGRWRVYRFGASLTGKMNHPASPNATGLEVDKLDKEAWRRYFRTYLEMYREAAGGMLGEKGITHILIDSYEAGTATWTPRLPEEFKARRGYDPLPLLPVLCGEIIGSPEESERFLFHWRKTLAELFEENYNEVNAIAAQFGMKGSYIESHEGGRVFNGDGMQVKKNATVPMSAIWMTDCMYGGSMLPSAVSDIRESASVAHIYGQNIAAAESFTVNGDGKAAYTYHPGNIKMIADVALASGLNRFIIHDSASQPSDDYLPGLGLFKYGQWFHRNETWAPYARVWTDYLARSSAMMQAGRNVADILVFYGEDSNATAVYGGEYLQYLPRIPAGYNYDYASPDVLLNKVQARDGRLLTESGQCYRVLVVAESARILSEPLKARMEEIRKAGVPVCREIELEDVLKANGVLPDVSVSGLGSDGLMYGKEGAVERNVRGQDATLPGLQFVHREVAGKADIYWLCNFGKERVRAKAGFRSERKYAARLNPEDGSAVRVNSLEIDLKPGDAVFYLLTDTRPDLPEEKAESREKVVLQMDRWWDVDFRQRGGEHATETFSVLNDWTGNSDPVVRYFSGTACYKSALEVPEGVLEGLSEARLDLGTVHVMAELLVNGHNAGVLWREPFLSPDILPWLKEGENEIEVKVTNLWVNRMIGDRRQGEKPVTRVRRFYDAGDSLLPSGLLGPVRMIGYAP